MPGSRASSTAVVTHARRRFGIYLDRSRRSIWIHAGSIEAFEGLAAFVRDLRPRVEIDRFVFTSADPRTCAWLRARYPNDNTVPVPYGAPWLIDRFLAQLNPTLLLWIGDAPGPSRRILDAARRRGVIALALDAVRLEDLRSVLETLPRDPLPDPTAPRRTARLAATPVGRRLAETLGRRRLADWQSLRERLRFPRSILCLGNGPSAEDPAVLAADHDCLMRVNWRWRDRGKLDRPDLVFVGDLRTTLELPPTVFGFRDVTWEREVLLRHAILGLRSRRLEHFTLERVPSVLSEPWIGPRPTNGAIMVAVAAALGAERLTIAGIDLYEDPRGRYPWDRIGDNAFPQMHRHEVEVETIRRALDVHRGEVVIASEPLRRALDRPPRAPARARSPG